MKKLFLILCMSPLICLAQTNVNKAKPMQEFCMLTMSPGFFSGKMYITVDHGLDMSVDTVVQKLTIDQRNEIGDLKKFTSIIQALNYMAAKRWTLVNSYQFLRNKDAYELHYILKRDL